MADLLSIASLAVGAGVPLAQGAFKLRSNRIALKKQRAIQKGQGAKLFGTDVVRAATQFYVEPECQTNDPAQNEEGSQEAPKQRLMAFARTFLTEQRNRKHLLVLAGSGMGKTTFSLNLYAWSVSHMKDSQVVVVPLGSDKSDQAIADVGNPESTCLILDALDEDTQAMDNTAERFDALMQLTKNFRRIIITSRTQFFSKDNEIPDNSGVARFGPRAGSDAGSYELERRYLSPLSASDVKAFLWKRYPFLQWGKRREATNLVRLMPKLVARPMLLARVPELLVQGNAPTSTWELYENLVVGWYERENYWIRAERLRIISRKLAVEIFSNAKMRGGEHISMQQLATFLKSEGLDFDERLVASRSLLNRDAEGNCKFAHRSILEFLVAQAVVEGASDYLSPTELIESFLSEKSRLNCEVVLRDSGSVSASGAYLKGAHFLGKRFPNANLQGANLQGANLQGARLRGARLQGANLEGAKLQRAKLQHACLQSSNLEHANLESANLEGVNLECARLKEVNLEGVRLKEANLPGAKLKGTSLEEADLQRANLQRANLQRANLQRANLQHACLQVANLEHANLEHANLEHANLDEANLRGASLQGASLQNADLQGAKLQRADLRLANLQRASLRLANLQHAGLQVANLQHANLQRANAKDVNVQAASLQGAKLENADLQGADLEHADLRAANLQGANLKGARNLTQAQLDKACGSAATQLPEGLTIPTCPEDPQN